MLYSFSTGHPFNNSRLDHFSRSLSKLAGEENYSIEIEEPISASDDDLRLFHSPHYIDFVKSSSKAGLGYLDYGDTPSFKGVYEAALFSVGSTLHGLERIIQRRFDHYFNPGGGLHHARRERAGGFCVFNDAAIAIEKALDDFGLARVAYVDIDAHHGDGVFFGFEANEKVIIADIHEDGRFLYPGTGGSTEMGMGKAKGTKLNIPLPPSSGDEIFIKAFDRVEEFVRRFQPEFIFFQCGADGLSGDPITHLNYSANAHLYATTRLHELAHEICHGRLLAMGGGGYNAANVNVAWSSVIEALAIRA